MEYLEARAGEPCGKTCLTTFLSGFSFMEKLGQVPVELRFSSNDLVKGAVVELTRNLRSTGLIQAPLTALDSGLCLGKSSRGLSEADNGSSLSVDEVAQVQGLHALRRSDVAGS